MPKKLILALATCSALVVMASEAGGDPAVADRHQERAIEYYKYGRYGSAAIEFERAFREDPQPVRLFSWAQAERQAKNCRKAIQLYREFLAMEPSARDIEAAEFGIAECRKKVEKARDDRKSEDGSVGSPDGDSRPDPGSGSTGNGDGAPVGGARAGDDTRAWYRDTRGVLYAGGGIALLAVGLGTYLSARSLVTTALDEADTHDEFTEYVDAARARRNVAVVLGLGGAALITLAVLRYRTVRSENASLSVTPTAGPDVVGLVIDGRF